MALQTDKVTHCVKKVKKNKAVTETPSQHYGVSIFVNFNFDATELKQGAYKFNSTNFQEIPGGISRKIQDTFACLLYTSPSPRD